MEIKKEVFEELESIRFPKTKTRTNISKDSIESFCLGDVNYRGQRSLNFKTRGESRYNKKFPELHNILKYFINKYHPEFQYTTIQINKNIVSPPHIDKNNIGPSYIIGLGNYEGGRLFIEGKGYNIKNRWKFFDGTKGHWVEKFKGTRYTIIYFTHTFKPPHPSLRNIKVTTKGIYKNNTLLKKYS